MGKCRLARTPLGPTTTTTQNLYDNYAEGLPWEHSDVLHFSDWDAVAVEREKAKAMRSEGLMLKKANAL